MTEITIQIEELEEIIKEGTPNASLIHLVNRERAKLPKLWALPEKHIYTTTDYRLTRGHVSVELSNQFYRQEIMMSLWDVYGNGHEFNYSGQNYFPYYDKHYRQFFWRKVKIEMNPNTFYYKEMSLKVLDYINKHKELLAEGV